MKSCAKNELKRSAIPWPRSPWCTWPLRSSPPQTRHWWWRTVNRKHLKYVYLRKVVHILSRFSVTLLCRSWFLFLYQNPDQIIYLLTCSSEKNVILNFDILNTGFSFDCSTSSPIYVRSKISSTDINIEMVIYFGIWKFFIDFLWMNC